MKRLTLVILAALSLTTVSCGGDYADLSHSRRSGTSQSEDENGNVRFLHTKETLVTANGNVDDYADGAHFHVSNFLAQHRPELSFSICSVSDHEPGEGRSDAHERLCFVSESMIKFGESADFYLPKQDLDRLLTVGNSSSFSVGFNDTYSRSLIHWYCWGHTRTKVSDPNGLNKYNIEATQINMASYSCRLETTP